MALQRIVLSDFVIVHRLELELHGGFTVLTGETGAGKSILIDALQLVLGARADSAVVREGASRCEVSAEFDLAPAVTAWLVDNGFDSDDHPGLLLRRTVDAQGRSKAWINGSAATAGQLKGLADLLVDIHGQHAWQSLTRPDAVRHLLDAYSGLLGHGLPALWTDWREALKALDSARSQATTRQQESERLSWQITEVGKLAPEPDEWQELNTQHTRLSNAQDLIDAAQGALAALDDDETSALALLSRAAALLQAQAGIEPRFAEVLGVLEDAQAQLQDSVHTLQHYGRHTELDPSALAALDQRLTNWVSLARRYRCTPEELPLRLAEWKRQLADIDSASDLGALQKTADQCEAAFMKEARRLSRQRQQGATRLSAAITEAMQDLGMAGGRFEVRLAPLEAPQAHGLEQVEFLVAGHAGATPRPVGKVASGGELSRIALAISVTTSELGEAPTLIFDEVDSGVGGAVAQTVGRLMQRLGHDRQVLAVTHLPQVAACADHHLRVSKRSQGQATLSEVQALPTTERVAELARMLGGNAGSNASLAHARELLETAAQ
jgi:DNA repair protein RecN (Recombination protein N)